jgi:hypothetical protein
MVLKLKNTTLLLLHDDDRALRDHDHLQLPVR